MNERKFMARVNVFGGFIGGDYMKKEFLVQVGDGDFRQAGLDEVMKS